jgi:hypothetical protein
MLLSAVSPRIVASLIHYAAQEKNNEILGQTYMVRNEQKAKSILRRILEAQSEARQAAIGRHMSGLARNWIEEKPGKRALREVERARRKALARSAAGGPPEAGPYAAARKAFSGLAILVREAALNIPLSWLGGRCQDIRGASNLRLLLPMEVLKNSPDMALALNKLGLLKNGVSFELVVTGVTDGDIEAVKRLERADIKSALRLPANVRISLITEAEIRERAVALGRDASLPKVRACLTKDIYLETLGRERPGKGEYMAIAAAVDTKEEAEGLKAEEDGLSKELDENLSMLLLVRPQADKTAFSLGAIISSWLLNIRQKNGPSISIILPEMVSPAEMLKTLGEAVRNAWQALSAA